VSDQAAGTSDKVPVFPLPEVVLFPGQILPLHVFEPRYRAMVEDALEGRRLIAAALLKPGFERQYFTKHAPIHPIMGLGQIVASEELTDGRFNILLRGFARVERVCEVDGRVYRRARLRLLKGTCSADRWEQAQLRDELRDAVRDHLSHQPTLQRQCLQLFRRDLSLETLTDLISGGLPMNGELRQCLLCELDLVDRTNLLLEQLRTLGAIARRNHVGLRELQWSVN
jgi:Lon protease-like protein